MLLAASVLCGCREMGPAPAYQEYVVVKIEAAYDQDLRQTRPRLLLEKVPLDSLAGWNGRQYAQAKTFSVEDTVTFRVGTHLWAEGEVVAYARQTPFRTRYEWLSTGQRPPGYVPYPELELSRHFTR